MGYLNICWMYLYHFIIIFKLIWLYFNIFYISFEYYISLLFFFIEDVVQSTVYCILWLSRNCTVKSQNTTTPAVFCAFMHITNAEWRFGIFTSDLSALRRESSQSSCSLLRGAQVSRRSYPLVNMVSTVIQKNMWLTVK